MAFLDNSGDIILDAVLTDAGRERLAKGDGSFKITKFALAMTKLTTSCTEMQIVQKVQIQEDLHFTIWRFCNLRFSKLSQTTLLQ